MVGKDVDDRQYERYKNEKSSFELKFEKIIMIVKSDIQILQSLEARSYCRISTRESLETNQHLRPCFRFHSDESVQTSNSQFP